MIYLIEDKTSRRIDYGWSDKRFQQYSDIIRVICNLESFTENKEAMLLPGSIVLYHESFPNSVDYGRRRGVETFIDTLKERGVMLAYFSGSKSQRTINDNVCNLPPHVLYSNLGTFIDKVQAGENDFRYLMFGSKPELEDDLRESIIAVNNDNIGLPKVNTDKHLFFFVTSEEPLDVPFEGNNIEVQDAFDFDCDDTSLCEIIRRNLDNKIDALFVPLCFGETLSDFMGLRLAMMIRFSTNPNKLTPIIIYGEASYTDLLDLECFDILKMPGVSLVHSDFSSLQATAHTWKDISNSAYSAGLKNIHLHIPSDIGDNHSLSNKWAIHRWATAMNISEENDFDKVEAKVSENLYFRYLSALNSLKNAIKVNQKDMTIQKDSSNPKILLVDDQADEGWYEIMCHILYDINNIEFDCIGYYGELKAKTSDEIIELVKSKVESKNPDIVILDLRLCNSDYNTSKVKDMCGNKLLRKIKQHNRGIQVLMFSATNKVWNYQYLLNSEDDVDGADGFIIKEKPEDSVNVYFTKEVIKLFVASVTKCCQLTYRKALWVDLQNDLIKCSCSNSEYANFVFKLLELAQESLFAKQTNYTCASVFMNFFRVIEATANQYIDSYAKVDEETGQYYFLSKDGKPLWRFNTNDSAEPTETLLLDKKSLPYYQKICNTLMLLGAYSTHAYDIVKKRNAFEHPNADWQDSLQEFDISDVQNVFEIVHQLIQNQDNI